MEARSRYASSEKPPLISSRFGLFSQFEGGKWAQTYTQHSSLIKSKIPGVRLERLKVGLGAGEVFIASESHLPLGLGLKRSHHLLDNLVEEKRGDLGVEGRAELKIDVEVNDAHVGRSHRLEVPHAVEGVEKLPVAAQRLHVKRSLKSEPRGVVLGDGTETNAELGVGAVGCLAGDDRAEAVGDKVLVVVNLLDSGVHHLGRHSHQLALVVLEHTVR